MACLPYPTLLSSPSQTSATQSLFAVGRVRIHPLTCPGIKSGDNNNSNDDRSAQEEYQAIISKCIQQSQVVIPTTDDNTTTTNTTMDKDKDDIKAKEKLRKKYMKERPAMATSYLTKTLGIDISIIDVEIVLNIDSIMNTDGCLASCFLDAGCAYVVVRVKDDNDDTDGLEKALVACDTTRVPKERLILHYKSTTQSSEMISKQMENITSRVGTISIQMTTTCSEWNDIVSSSKQYKTVVQLAPLSTNDDTSSNEELIASVAALSKVIGENRGSITLVDPTAQQLGLCYAACMKTDRPDGLYTTVVCTRSNEALGLVYSSKVCVFHFANFAQCIIRCIHAL